MIVSQDPDLGKSEKVCTDIALKTVLPKNVVKVKPNVNEGVNPNNQSDFLYLKLTQSMKRNSSGSEGATGRFSR